MRIALKSGQLRFLEKTPSDEVAKFSEFGELALRWRTLRLTYFGKREVMAAVWLLRAAAWTAWI